jgi:sugar lactone lactonase YvrE
MKNFILHLFLLSTTLLNGQNLLSGPECITFDSLHNRYLVSNWTNGNIIAIDSAGNQSYFKQRSGNALGNCIDGNTFYVSIGNTILGLNLDNPNDTIMYLTVAGTTQMDGMTVDNNNNLYVVEVLTAKIYKVNLLTHTYSTFISSAVSSRPQDVIYDRDFDRLLVCSWYANSPIQAVNLNDSTISTLVNTLTGNCDGLALDGNGNYYFSTWANNSIYYYDTTFSNPPTLLSSGHNGPANICFNKRDNIIAVPNFNSNSVSFVSISPSSVNDDNDRQMNFNLYQNYPNPFNPSTKIKFTLTPSLSLGKRVSEGQVRATLKVYDVLGNEIATLVNEEKPAGEYEVEFDGSVLTSGIYFYQLAANNFFASKK